MSDQNKDSNFLLQQELVKKNNIITKLSTNIYNLINNFITKIHNKINELEELGEIFESVYIF